MKSIANILLISGLLASTAFADDTIPGAPQKKPIALVGGTVHTVSGDDIVNGTVLFDNGRIVAVGTDVQIPEGAKQVNVAGKHVYPGLFESHSSLGLVEVASVRATRDHSEAGSMNPNVQANRAVNPDSMLFAVTRSNGVLLALTTPQGGTVSGRASILQLDGWT